jgi:hypothetical protein
MALPNSDFLVRWKESFALLFYRKTVTYAVIRVWRRMTEERRQKEA